MQHPRRSVMRSPQSPQSFTAIGALKIATKFMSESPWYSGLAVSLLLTGILGVASPDPKTREVGTHGVALITGVWLTTLVSDRKFSRTQCRAEELRAKDAQITARQNNREAEIANRQQALVADELKLAEAEARLKTFEDSYKVKADANATRTAQKAADIRIKEIERNATARTADAEKRSVNAIKDANASVRKMQATLDEQTKAIKLEAAGCIALAEKDRDEAIATALLERDEAIAAAEKAKADSQLVVNQYSEMIQTFERECEQKRRDIEDKAAGKIIAIKQRAKGLESVIANGAKDYRQVIETHQAKTVDDLNSLSSEILKMSAELTAHKQLVAKLQAPKQFTQSTIEAQVGNRIQSFLSARGVVLSCADIGVTRYGEVAIYFEALNCDFKDVDEQLDALNLHLGFNRKPDACIENGKIKILTKISSELKPKADVIKRVSDTKLRQAFLDIPFGLRFTGYTGRGKSTLLNNVIDLYELEMGVRFIIFDPKVDFPSAIYPKNTVYRGLPKCVANIDLIGATAKARQDYRVLNDEQGTPIPAQHKLPKLFLIDECKDIHDSAAQADLDLPYKERINVKNFKFSVQKGLEVGRGLGVRVLYSTVTPDSSDFGFKNSVFKQSATVFLGDQCYEALNTKSQYLTTVSDMQKAQLRQEYEARVASLDERDNFIGLFFNGLTNQVFFFAPPAPDAWKIDTEKPVDMDMAQYLAQKTGSAESQAQQSAQGSAEIRAEQRDEDVAQEQRESGATFAPTVSQLSKKGVKCPECNAVSNSFKSKRPRKSDSTVLMRCKTQGCESGGFFRAKVSK